MLLIAFLFPLFLTLIFAFCPDESVEWQNSCYSFQSNLSSFTNAELACIKLNGHLVSIHNGFTNVLIAGKASDLFHESTETDFWIGLDNLMIPGNWSWMDGTTFDFNNWAPSEPQNLSMNCVAVTIQNGYWIADDCFKTKPFVCEVPEIIPTTQHVTLNGTTQSYPVYENCSHGWIYFEPTHSCYGSDDTGFFVYTWTNAEQYCIKQGAHIFSLHSFEETKFVSALIDKTDKVPWTGLYSNDNEITWHWSDGSPVNYLPWGSGQPQLKASSCGYLYRDEHMYDADCQNTALVICKRPAPKY